MNPRLLLKWLSEKKISLVHIVPSLFRLILNELENGYGNVSELNCCKTFLLAGESLYGSDVEKWRKVAGDSIELVNLYGPSESTLAKVFNRITDDTFEPDKIVPIGKPISNTAILILNNNELCRVGEIGEIYIKTPFLSKGYSDNPELTASSFIQNPLFTDAEDIVYKTGDLGRYLPDRSVDFVGRKDNQVKINGIRIEPAEIENALNQHDKIVQAVVTVHNEVDHISRLICYYQTKEQIDAADLRSHLKKFVLDYMMPSYFVQVDSFPLTPNGKIDRKALLLPEEFLPTNGTRELPSNDIERKIAGIWQTVLNCKSPAVDDDFFETGGHSLNAIRIISQIYKQFEIEIKLADFMSGPTIRSLAELVEQSNRSIFRAIVPVEKKGNYPVSYGQRRLWIVDQISNGSSAYHISGAYLFEGEFNFEIFCKAFSTIVERHESLRTKIVVINNEPCQVITNENVVIEKIDLSSKPDKNDICREIAAEEAVKKFNLAEDMLLRIKLVELTQDKHVMILVVHHIISDALSFNVLAKELRDLYKAYLKGQPNPYIPLKIQYKDYASWQNSLIESDSINNEREYWHRKLSKPIPVLNLPLDNTRPMYHSSAGKTVSFALNEKLTANLESFCKENSVSLFTVLLSLVKVLLYRYTGQEDIIVGTTIANRNHPDLEHQVGYFVNTLALRDNIHGSDNFMEIVKNIKLTTNEAFDNHNYPFDQLVDDLDLERDASRSPLFDVGLVLHNEEDDMPVFEGVKISPFEFKENTSKFDILWNFEKQKTGLSCKVNFNSELFNDDTIERSLEHLKRLLNSALEQPTLQIEKLQILPDHEISKLLDQSRGRTVNNEHETIVAMFEDSVIRHALSTALIFNDESFTYQALNEMANKIANYLIHNFKLSPEQTIAVIVEPSARYVAAILGIMKSSSVFVSIDSTYPAERINFIINDSRSTIILTDNPLIKDTVEFDSTNIIDINKINESDNTNPEIKIEKNQLAYIIYTSGSTGTPKGVLIEHYSFVNMINCQISTFEVTPADNVLQFAPVTFDASMSEIFMALLSGACLTLIKKETKQNIDDFIKFVESNNVTHITFPPVYLSALGRRLPGNVKTIITAGEQAVARDALYYSNRASYFNAYGPSECAVCASIYKLDPEKFNRKIVPIGKPVSNCSIYIVDGSMNLVPDGIAGEICISGPGVARGYAQDELLTSTKFIVNPFAPSERLYLTGDTGKRLSDGDIVFTGRKDEQLKIRGYRVEPAEIEKAMVSYEGIETARVIANERGDHGKELVCYFSPEKRVELWPSVAEFFVYDDLLYRAMYTDVKRNNQYLKAFKRHLKDKIVLEIGPGPEAVLSKLCIEAGAKRVYAVEILESTYNKVKEHVTSLGLDDKITVIHGDIFDVKLPEKVDYCISEIVGSIGGSEGAAKIINKARELVLQPDAIIPTSSVTKIVAISLPEDMYDNCFSELAAHYVDKIFDQIGYSFDLRICLKNFPEANIISLPDIFEDLQFTQEMPLEEEHEIRLSVNKQGTFTGFLVWLNLNLDLDETIEIDILESPGSWLPVYFPINIEGIEVFKGDYFKAVITRKLCDNNLNPDYFIKGDLIRNEEPVYSFTYTSYHMAKSVERTPFYNKLFSTGTVPVKPEMSVNSIRDFLANKLPDYMMPSHFVELENLPVTSSGKLDLNALPSPGKSGIRDEASYVKPCNDQQSLMAQVWENVIGKEQIGVNSNFFSLGGDSIKAIQVVSKLKQYNWKIETADIFTFPTIAELVNKMVPLKHEINQDAVSGYVPLSPVQTWFFKEFSADHNHFNQSVLLYSERKLHEAILGNVISEIVNHHDVLRMRYVFDNNKIEQFNPGNIEDQIHESFTVNDLSAETDQFEILKTRTGEIHTEFDLKTGPLLKATMFRLTEGDYLFLCVHHLVIDTVSWRILLEDISSLYNQSVKNKPVKLPEKTNSYKDWAEQVVIYAEKEELLKEIDYWLDIESKETSIIPVDYPSASCLVRENNSFSESLSAEDTEALLTNVNDAYKTSVNDILLVTLALMFKKWNGNTNLLIDLESHGREEIFDGIDINRTVGWFTSFYPVILELPDNDDIGLSLKQVKEIIRKVPDKGFGHNIIKYITKDRAKDVISFNLKPVVGFNYYGQFDDSMDDSIFKITGDVSGQNINPDAERFHEIDFSAQVVNKTLEFAISYSSKRYKSETIKTLLWSYKEELQSIINYCISKESTELTPSDFSYKGLDLEDLDLIFQND